MDREVQAETRKSLFRTGREIKETKQIKGGLTSATWCLYSTVGSTVSCQATSGSKLATQLSEEVRRNPGGDRRLILEERGHLIHLEHKLKNPFSTQGCKYNDPDCLVRPNKDCSIM